MIPLMGYQRITQLGSNAAISGNTPLVGGAANTKGAYVQFSAATPHDAHWVMLQFGNQDFADYLIDIAIGAAASEQIIISNFPYGHPVTGNLGVGSPILIPLFIPAGTRISARCQNNVGAFNVFMGIFIIQGDPLNVAGSSVVTTYGANTADSGGVSVDPGATIHTKGAYSEITPATTRDIQWIVICIGNQANSARASYGFLLDIAIGAAASEYVIIANLLLNSGTGPDTMDPCYFCFPIRIPAGTRIAARAQCSGNDATDRLFDVAVVGVS